VLTSRRIDLPPYTFWESRAGSGPPVVLLHGLGGSSDWWRHNVDVLAERYLVSTVDLVGFGRNRFFLRNSKLPLRFDDIAALLARWIESSFDEPVHLVGNSMGGQIAIHLAASRPELVRSLILVDSTGIPFEITPGVHIANLALPYGWRSFFLILTRDLFRAGPTALSVAFARLLRDDVRPLMRTLTMPVLLIWGESDPLVPLTYARQMVAEMPNATLRVIPRAGHIPMWENPRAFNEALLSFLHDLGTTDGESAAAFSWGLSGWTNGIAHRAAGLRRDVVLIHGLGMSSAYFVNFARALFARGTNPIAPDLPGFGQSIDGPAAGPEEHAQILASWADTLSIRNATWIGHSFGCNAAVHLARTRPDIVSRVICIGPVWSPRAPSRLLGALLLDVFRERLALAPGVIRAYWRCGLARWFSTFLRYRDDLRIMPRDTVVMMAGERDPLVDRKAIPNLQSVPGAHACHFSNPEETAETVEGGRVP
jgi:pimeloyl-ACP methyl ester carboxylesterase